MNRLTNMTYWNMLPDFSREALKKAEETRKQDKEQGK